MTTKLVLAFVLVGAPAVPAQGGEEPPPTTAAKPISYHHDVRPILQEHCMGCHQPAKPNGDLVLTSYVSMMAGIDGEDPVVEPGAPDDSFLIEVLTAVDGGQPTMPEDSEPLADPKIELLRRWIAEGANDDSPAHATRPIDPENPPTYTRPPVITSLDYAPDGALLATSGYHEVLLHTSDGSRLVGRLVGMSERIESVTFSPDGTRLCAVGGSPARMGEVQIWNVAEQTLDLSVTIGHDCLYGASWSKDGKLVAFGATDSAVRAVDARTGELVLFQGAHGDWVLDTVFSSDSSHLITVSRDRSMKLIHVAEQQFIDNITSITPGALKGGLMTVDRHPREDVLLVGGADGVPKLYQTYRTKARKIGDDYNRLRTFQKMPGRIFAAKFGPFGELVAVGSSHRGCGEVRLYRVADGALVWSHAAPSGVFTLAFRDDAKTIATGGFAGVVELIDVNTGWLERQFVPFPIETGDER